MTLPAALFFLVTHAFVVGLAGPGDPVGSFLMSSAAPLLAAMACVRRARDSHAACKLRTFAFAVSLFPVALLPLLFPGITDAWPAQVALTSLILYVFYRIPLTYVAASADSRNRHVRSVDLSIIGLLWLLYYTHAQSTAQLDTALWTHGLNAISTTQNSLLFSFALIRYLAEDNADRRDFFRTLTLFLLGYFLIEQYVSRYRPQTPDGGWADLLISGLFLLLAVIAGSPRRRTAPPVPRNLRRFVEASVPLMLPLLLMLVALLMARTNQTMATVGFIGAMLGYALRSVLSQVDIQRQRDDLAALARRDPLTGLGNSSSFDESLPGAQRRARRQGLGLAVLMIDIDHFKRLNDTYGHPEGDRRLQAVAAIIDGCLQRGDDLLARYGGEEFIAALPSSDVAHAMAMGERIRVAVEDAALPSGPSSVTVSIGVAWLAADARQEPDSVVERADQALYRAKRAGRNCVRGEALPERTAAPALRA